MKDFLQSAISQCIRDCRGNDELLIKELERLVTLYGLKTYQAIFQTLTSLNLEATKARDCWLEILNLKRRMGKALGRNVSIQTAICDYFSSVNKTLCNPKIIEIKLFDEIVRSSKLDGLTKLLNRGTFDEELTKEVSRAKRNNEKFSLVFFDLDNFKKVNDLYGHQAGDAVLRKCAAIINRFKRIEDIAARFGGEELVLLLPNTDKMNAMNIAERVRYEIEKMVVCHNGQKIGVTLSGGVSSFPEDTTDRENLIRLADEAMYRAKNFGKNNIIPSYAKDRRSQRYDYCADVGIRHLGMGSIQCLSATSKNISVDGILLESDILLELGTTLEIAIKVNDDKKLLLIGRVVRINQVDGRKYDVGISFPNRIKDTITDHLLRSQKPFYNSGSLSVN